LTAKQWVFLFFNQRLLDSTKRLFRVLNRLLMIDIFFATS
jgi:hypothetical protein